MTRKSDPPTTEGMSLQEAQAFLARESQMIGEPLAEVEVEVTRALRPAEVGLPAEYEGNTVQLVAEGSLPADIEGPTLQRTVVLDKPVSTAPVGLTPIDDDPVPVTEGTALLPRDFVERALGRPAPAPTAAPTSVTPKSSNVRSAGERASRGRPWLVGVLVFAISLIVFGGAAVAFIWRSQL